MKLNPSHPALSEARSIHLRMIRSPLDAKNVLKEVTRNSKLGNGSKWITKGKWRAMPMFSLTLQERDTCPRTCHHWDDCYGNNMAFAHRIAKGNALEDKLREEIATLALYYPNGFVIRLHVLGDFYSLQYVELWADLLTRYQNLHIFGYTARKDCPIGIAIDVLNSGLWGDRVWIRKSMKESFHGLSAVEIPSPVAITCPQQTGKTKACITCGLCWSVTRPIHFLNH